MKTAKKNSAKPGRMAIYFPRDSKQKMQALSKKLGYESYQVACRNAAFVGMHIAQTNRDLFMEALENANSNGN